MIKRHRDGSARLPMEVLPAASTMSVHVCQRGVSRNYSEAAKWYPKAPERGFPHPQAALTRRVLTW
jgi:hypothetical protein